MNSGDIQKWLDEELANFPDRVSGEELYRYLGRLTARVAIQHRGAFVQALEKWLALREEPRTMIAVKLAARYHLHELASSIRSLLVEVENGDVFFPYYSRWIRPVVQQLERLA